MWAMIGMSIALGFWTAGLTFLTWRADKRRVLTSAEVPVEAKDIEAVHEREKKIAG